jgi:hypothetical protein
VNFRVFYKVEVEESWVRLVQVDSEVGETYDWVVNDMAVINLGAAFVASPINEQITVTIACDANGYNYNSYSSGSALDAEFPVISLPGFG